MIKKFAFLRTVHEFILVLGLIFFVLVVNLPVISLDMMYAEQPMLYLANQGIHSFRDLANVYLHPQILHIFSIPFFRPSGHFLIYQLVTPFLGWHNTRGFMIINLIFLALTGYIIIKLYTLLFPHFKTGGYLAFSFYLMHPALMLSRLIVLHFEFAYVFFVMASLYWFVRFCTHLHHSRMLLSGIYHNGFPIKAFGNDANVFHFLAYSLFFYAVAVTFKEPAIMLGPVLLSFFCISLYHKQPLLKYFYSLINNKNNRQVIILIAISSISLGLYLTLPWEALAHPLQNEMTSKRKLAAINEFLKIIFSLPYDFSSIHFLEQSGLFWRDVFFPLQIRFIVWAFLAISFISSVLIFGHFPRLSSLRGVTSRHDGNFFLYKKSLFFLFLASFLFLIMPINYAMGLPWHLSLTLIFLSVGMGFCCEYLCQIFIKNQKWRYLLGGTLAVFIGTSTITVNQVNIRQILMSADFYFSLARNAVFYPPDIKSKLNDQSIVVVEDSIVRTPYVFGNGSYPFFGYDLDFDVLEQTQHTSFLKYQPVYNGTLFRWAYLMPALQEELYPFQVEHMEKVPSAILYNWLQHVGNIFCLGYDREARWHDRTIIFKQNLLKEKLKRHLLFNEYTLMPATLMGGETSHTKILPFPDYQLCQFECDQNKYCKGLTYENVEYEQHFVIKCQFYDVLLPKDNKFCASCIGFIKIT